MVPSHYLNQCWNIFNWTLRNKLQWNFNRSLYIFIQENTCENVVWKMAAILSWPQCVHEYTVGWWPYWHTWLCLVFSWLVYTIYHCSPRRYGCKFIYGILKYTAVVAVCSSLVKLHAKKSHMTLLTISQHWVRWWLGANIETVLTKIHIVFWHMQLYMSWYIISFFGFIFTS